MEYIKKQVQLGNLSLARLNGNKDPVPINYSDLQSTQKTRKNYEQIVKKLKELSQQQKDEWINLKRLHANQLCKSKKWEQAIELYLETMLGINIQQKNEQKLRHINQEQKYPILLNIVTCNYNLKSYRGGIDICDKILAELHGKNHIKCLYKKCYCLIGLGQLQKARQLAQNLYEIIKRQSQNDQIVKKKDITIEDINGLFREIKNKMKKDKQMYKRFFFNKENQQEQEQQGLVADKQTEQVLIYKENSYERLKDFTKKIYRYLQDCLLSQHTKFQ